MTWCSICSGSEVILFVLAAIASAFRARHITLIFKHLFSCEIVPAKQEWIMGAFEEGNVEEGCLFERAEDLGQEYAQCVKHGRKCRVPHADIVIAGTSCKDLSRANSTNFKGKPCVLTQEFSPGGSAQTYRGLMLYLGRFTFLYRLLSLVKFCLNVEPVSFSAKIECSIEAIHLL